MARHTQQAIEAMQEALDHARIADAVEAGGLKTALCFALFRDELAATPPTLPSWSSEDPEEARAEHLAWIDERLDLLRTWLQPYWDSLATTPRDVVWAGVDEMLRRANATESVA